MTGWAQWLVDGLLAAGVLGVAALALTVRDRITAVALFVVFGLLVAAGYARLAAPDIALAEAAIGAAVTGALLLDAVRPRAGGAASDTHPSGRRRPWGWTVALVLAALGTAGVLAAAAGALLDRPGGPGLADLVAERVPDSGVAHPVTAVLLAFRAYDTLLEVVVLLVAGLVALALLPVGDPTDAPRPAPPPAALPFLTRFLVPVGIVVAGWLVLVGSYGPGGAFQGGTVLAGILVLLWLSGRRLGVLGGAVLRWGLTAGTAIFLGVGAMTLLLGDGFLDYGPAASVAIVAIEAAIALSVGVTLAALYLAEEPVPPAGTEAGTEAEAS